VPYNHNRRAAFNSTFHGVMLAFGWVSVVLIRLWSAAKMWFILYIDAQEFPIAIKCKHNFIRGTRSFGIGPNGLCSVREHAAQGKKFCVIGRRHCAVGILRSLLKFIHLSLDLTPILRRLVFEQPVRRLAFGLSHLRQNVLLCRTDLQRIERWGQRLLNGASATSCLRACIVCAACGDRCQNEH